MADEIVVNEASEETPVDAPTIVVAPVIVNDSGEDSPPAETHCEHCAQHEQEIAALREQVGVLAGATAVIVADEVVEEQVEETPPPVVEETTIEGEGEEEESVSTERHAGIFI